MSLAIVDFKGNSKGSETIPACFQLEKINQTLIWEVVTAAQANLRQGTHKTKVKGEVSGGGIKPWKQKGTGRARAGSNRSPLWKGGGTTFGPLPRDYRQDIPTKKKNAAFKNILADKILANKVVLLDEIKLEKASTSEAFSGINSVISKAPFFASYSENRKLRAKTNDKHRQITLIYDGDDKAVKLSFRNIPWVSLVSSKRIAALPLFYNHGLVITKNALQELTKRFEG